MMTRTMSERRTDRVRSSCLASAHPLSLRPRASIPRPGAPIWYVLQNQIGAPSFPFQQRNRESGG
eukprot:1709021-Rhodomonas_salina.3